MVHDFVVRCAWADPYTVRPKSEKDLQSARTDDAHYSYDKAGNQTAVRLGDTRLTRKFFKNGQLKTRIAERAGKKVEYAYRYSSTGKLTSGPRIQ